MLDVTKPKTMSVHSVLAWNATVTALALEKLRQKKELRNEERSAMERVAEELDSLAKASHIPAQSVVRGDLETPTGRLRQSFFTLVALEESVPQNLNLPSFEELCLDLCKILEAPIAAADELLGRAQDRCFDLLDQLAGRLPSDAGELQ